MAFPDDLNAALSRMRLERERLDALVQPLPAKALDAAQPGGWNLRRVLHHVIDAEATYAKLLAHQCGGTAPSLDTTEPEDGAHAITLLQATRAAVLELIDGVDADSLYAMQRYGHEEYSALSVLQNIASHDVDHYGQIAQLAASVLRRPAAPPPSGITIRPASIDDLPRIVEIYNHYIVNTPITFDLEPVTVAQRRPWFEQFAETGRHRLLVATDADGVLAGYAGTHQFRTKAAYDTTVETTIYCAPEATGRGIGPALYTALFDLIAGEDIHTLMAGITLPNDVSVRLHERFGFTPAGVMHAVGRKFGQYWDVGWFERAM